MSNKHASASLSIFTIKSPFMIHCHFREACTCISLTEVYCQISLTQCQQIMQKMANSVHVLIQKSAAHLLFTTSFKVNFHIAIYIIQGHFIIHSMLQIQKGLIHVSMHNQNTNQGHANQIGALHPPNACNNVQCMWHKMDHFNGCNAPDKHVTMSNACGIT